MHTAPERACLAIADVSGYTSYIAGVELDHAQDIIADLISTIVGAMEPFRLAKLEGDAAFTYLPGETIDASALQDTIEATYVAFRSRLRNIQQASTCECNACTLIPALDLKFVVHFGEIAHQRMLGTDELVGQDVILVHRLLKNEVVAETGIKAYALYTQACLDAAEVDPAGQPLTSHAETTDVAGEVRTWLRDLHEVWRVRQEAQPRAIPDELLLREETWEVPTPPPVTFEYLTSPRLRPLWDATITSFDEDVADGRRGVGTVNHCLHGEDAVEEEVLEWRPPDYWLLQGYLADVPGRPGLYLSDELELTAQGGTLVHSRVGRLEETAVPDEVQLAVGAEYVEAARRARERLQQVLEDLATERAELDDIDLPRSQGRFLDEPVAP